MRRVAQAVRVVPWLVLAVGLLWVTLRWPDAGSFWVTAGFAVFSLLAAVSIALGWRIGRWFGVGGGIVLILYAFALVLLGTEDVGGLGVSLPCGFALLAFGIWNVGELVREPEVA